jgi:hypothetical protein
MMKFELLKDAGVLVIEPSAPLSADDFRAISQQVDPYIRETGKLSGVLIDAPSFPGWESFGALIEHLKFIENHQRKIDRIAVVTESEILKIVPAIAAHFAHPEFRIFRRGEKDVALAWVKQPRS